MYEEKKSELVHKASCEKARMKLGSDLRHIEQMYDEIATIVDVRRYLKLFDTILPERSIQINNCED